MIKVLGLDVATKTGFALIEHSAIIDIGIIKLDSKQDYRERLQFLRKEIIKLLKKHHPDIVALEAVYATNNRQRQNVKTIALLNQMRGVVIESIPQKLELVDVYNRTAKKAILGSGSAKKDEVFSWVVDKYKLEDYVFSRDNDKTDAVLIALYAEQTIEGK